MRIGGGGNPPPLISFQLLRTFFCTFAKLNKDVKLIFVENRICSEEICFQIILHCVFNMENISR